MAAFINGWVERLAELGNFAGGYGSRNAYLSDWASIPNIPIDVWPASWYSTVYDPYATVFGIPWLDGFWNNHQRIRQYAGELNNNWGGVTLNIDINVADGMVAMPPEKPLAAPIVSPSPAIEDVGWLSAEQGWLVSGERLYWTYDRGETWVDISPAPIQLASILPSGQAWALSAPDQEPVRLYHSTTAGASWDSFELILPSASWWPLQLQFTSPSTGWIVMQKEASQVFDTGILLKTSDGGLTWQTSDLPSAAKINFTSQVEGWLLKDTLDELYHTTDGGLTWQLTQDEKVLFSQPVLPESATSSGWQTSSLGWSVTSQGSCSGDKSSPGFTCQVNTALWQTVDGGQNWETVPIPIKDAAKP